MAVENDSLSKKYFDSKYSPFTPPLDEAPKKTIIWWSEQVDSKDVNEIVPILFRKKNNEIIVYHAA